MIESLNGLHETVNFKDKEAFRLYDNSECEDYPLHWHTPLEILMPLRSTYSVVIDDGTTMLSEGDVMIIGSGVLHHLLPSQDGERLIFQVDFSLLHSIKELELMLTIISPSIVITESKDPDIHRQVSDIMLGIKNEYFGKAPLSEAAIYSKIIEMLVIIGRKYSTRSDSFDVTRRKQQEYLEKFMDICNFINANCTEDLTLDSVADTAGFSKYHFTRLFKQFTGYSFYKYLNQKRIECAEKLLIDPEISITEVSLRSGFPSLSSFIRMFRLIKGCTPTEFRNLHG